MDQTAENIGTDIIDEQAQTPAKGKKRLWLLAGLGSGLLIFAVAMFFAAARPPQTQSPGPTAEDIEQLKYDAEQKEQERQKASRIRNDNFVMRKEDDSQARLNSLLKDLDLEKDQATDQSAPVGDREARMQEEAIARIIRDPGPAPSSSGSFLASQSAPAPTSQMYPSSDADIRPMFVYSRSFGGAKYVDAAKQPLGQPDNAGIGRKNDVTGTMVKNVSRDVANDRRRLRIGDDAIDKHPFDHLSFKKRDRRDVGINERCSLLRGGRIWLSLSGPCVGRGFCWSGS